MKKDKTMGQNKIVVFESKKIGHIWQNEEWFFSVTDACGALINSKDPVIQSISSTEKGSLEYDKHQ